MDLYIHKHIKNITKNKTLKTLDVELVNRQIIRVPFDVVYDEHKSFVAERVRLHMYLQFEYERLKNERNI